MFVGIRRLFKSTGSKKGNDDNEAVHLQELLNNKTRELEDTTWRLEQLSNGDNDSEENEAGAEVRQTMARAIGPKSELSVQPDEESPLSEKDLSLFAEEADEEGREDNERSHSPADLFNQGEEEENPLRSLINSLPEVTARELLEQARVIRTMMLENKQREIPK